MLSMKSRVFTVFGTDSKALLTVKESEVDLKYIEGVGCKVVENPRKVRKKIFRIYFSNYYVLQLHT